jgi:transcriptional regulator with XRE-family HTH domain
MVRQARYQHQASISATGDRLTALMKERGISIAALAESVRIQRSTLENFREGHRQLPGDVLEAMAAQLGTSADFLMDRSDDPRPTEVVREDARQRALARQAES